MTLDQQIACAEHILRVLLATKEDATTAPRHLSPAKRAIQIQVRKDMIINEALVLVEAQTSKECVDACWAVMKLFVEGGKP